MKFYRIKLNHPMHKGTICTRMIIDNLDDLKKYHNLDAELSFHSLMKLSDDKLQRGHFGGVDQRTSILGTLLRLRVQTAKEGEKIIPLVEMANIVGSKFANMMKMINRGDVICMSEAGGYCDLKSFIKTWDGEVVEVIEKPSLGFPTSKEAMQSDTIVLENSGQSESSSESWRGSWHIERIKKHIPEPGTIGFIYSLREVDGAYVAKCINNCKNVYIYSQLIDWNQVNDFMNLFQSVVPGKNIYLEIPVKKINPLKEHDLFPKLNSLHNIVIMSNDISVI